MKYILLITTLSIIGWFNYKPIPNGIYKSSHQSYRTDYFLIVDKEEVIFYGWEVLEKDTLYFRSTAKFNSNTHLSFNKFEFQKEKVTENTLNTFIPNDSLNMPSFLLHRHLMDFSTLNGNISLKATKDIYDSRFDTFTFDKVKSKGD